VQESTKNPRMLRPGNLFLLVAGFCERASVQKEKEKEKKEKEKRGGRRKGGNNKKLALQLILVFFFWNHSISPYFSIFANTRTTVMLSIGCFHHLLHVTVVSVGLDSNQTKK
jgi:hypothetical protein